MSQVIIITGTPGTGKSTLAKEYVAKGLFRLDVSKHYKELSVGYNKKKQCYDIDMQKFEELVSKVVREHDKVVIDSHIAHLLPSKMVDECIVMICSNLKELRKRLEKRGYSKEKVEENVQVEIFQICLGEAKEIGHKVSVVDSAKA